MKTRIKKIKLHNCKLYQGMDGNRYLFADIDARLEVYEDSHEVSILGGRTCNVKKRKISLVVCSDVGKDFDEKAVYQITGDILRADGIYERLYFDNPIPVEIDLDGDWVFETEIPNAVNNLIYESTEAKSRGAFFMPVWQGVKPMKPTNPIGATL